MPATLPVGVLAGVGIQARWSAIIAFLFLLWFLATASLPGLLPNEHPRTYWSLAFISTLFLYLSAVAHELGHCLMARARSVAVQGITVSLFGGTSDVRHEDERPMDELLIAVAGPAVSAVLACAALALLLVVPQASPPLVLFLQALFLLNLWLSAFNLLPCMPLDGGRAVRALFWRLWGEYLRATRVATFLSRILAVFLATASIAVFAVSFESSVNWLPAWLGSDIRPLALLGLLAAWFLNNGARSAYRQAVVQERLTGLTVGEVMTPTPQTVAPWTNLEEVLSQHLQVSGGRAVAVVQADNVLVGLVAYGDLVRVPPRERASRTAGEVMTGARELVTVTPADPLETAIRHMAERHFNQLPVVQDGRFVGMIARADVLSFTEIGV